MTRANKQACLVEVMPTAVWRQLSDAIQPSKSKELTYSASGILFYVDSAYVITHSSILLSHFSKQKRIAKLHQANYLGRNTFKELKAFVTIEYDPKPNLSMTNLNENDGVHAQTVFNATSSNLKTKLEQYSGCIECIWKAEKFAKAVQSFLPSSENWSFFDDPNQNSKHSSDFNPEVVAELLPYFILIKLDDSPRFANHVHIPSHSLAIGDTVHMIGTPFGSMSPSVFLNSVSEGIVCNLAGSNQELILTDARCIPGTEGGPLYLGDATQSDFLVGVVTSALCWKANEWIGLSLACHIGDVLYSLRQHIHLPQILDAIEWKPETQLSQMSISQRQMPHCFLPVAMVRCHGSWGSGMLVDQERGVLLTCGHVVNGQKTVFVRLDQPTLEWFTADVVYATPVNQPFDIGVLKLRGYRPRHDCPAGVRIAKAVQEGEPSFVLGHALFGQQHNLPPMMTSGIISKVIMSKGQPILLQSTCSVNAGASGGALVSADGSVYGIVSCNAKDTASGACYPNINLVVPLETIWPTIKAYIENDDASILRTLHIDDQEIVNLWCMQGLYLVNDEVVPVINSAPWVHSESAYMISYGSLIYLHDILQEILMPSGASCEMLGLLKRFDWTSWTIFRRSST